MTVGIILATAVPATRSITTKEQYRMIIAH